MNFSGLIIIDSAQLQGRLYNVVDAISSLTEVVNIRLLSSQATISQLEKDIGRASQHIEFVRVKLTMANQEKRNLDIDQANLLNDLERKREQLAARNAARARLEAERDTMTEVSRSSDLAG